MTLNLSSPRPSKVGVATYLTSLQRVDHMLSDLEAKNLRVNEQAVDELGHLVRHGNGRLQDVYESILQEDVQKVEPLHFITKRMRKVHLHLMLS